MNSTIIFIIFFLAVIIVFVFVALNLYFQRVSIANAQLRPRPLMSDAERAFFHTLRQAVSSNYLVFPQVPIRQLIQRNGEIPRSLYSMFQSGIIDFVLVDSKYLGTLAVIELDDKSHRQVTARDRDERKEMLLKQANIPLVRFRVGETWNAQQIRTQIDQAIQSAQAQVSGEALKRKNLS
ncbi:MAG: DUF2726 domain-containing protein [Chloroflexi bacterium]|nr:DUF2726 domain-containing protein [Chloroflexota bacterium]